MKKLDFNTKIKPFGVSIYLDITLLLFVLLMMVIAGPGKGFLLSFVLILSILLHELGHVYAAKKMGFYVDRININGMGGAALINFDPASFLPKTEIYISMAGPIVSVFLTFIFYIIYSFLDYGVVQQLFLFSFILNGALSIFNILPLYPMDGGRVLHALLSNRYGDFNATMKSIHVTYVLGGIFSLASILLGQYLITIVLLYVIYIAYREDQLLHNI